MREAGPRPTRGHELSSPSSPGGVALVSCSGGGPLARESRVVLGEPPGRPWWREVGFSKRSLLRALGVGGVGLWVSGLQPRRRKRWEEALGSDGAGWLCA